MPGGPLRPADQADRGDRTGLDGRDGRVSGPPPSHPDRTADGTIEPPSIRDVRACTGAPAHRPTRGAIPEVLVRPCVVRRPPPTVRVPGRVRASRPTGPRGPRSPAATRAPSGRFRGPLEANAAPPHDGLRRPVRRAPRRVDRAALRGSLGGRRGPGREAGRRARGRDDGSRRHGHADGLDLRRLRRSGPDRSDDPLLLRGRQRQRPGQRGQQPRLHLRHRHGRDLHRDLCRPPPRRGPGLRGRCGRPAAVRQRVLERSRARQPGRHGPSDDRGSRGADADADAGAHADTRSPTRPRRRRSPVAASTSRPRTAPPLGRHGHAPRRGRGRRPLVRQHGVRAGRASPPVLLPRRQRERSGRLDLPPGPDLPDRCERTLRRQLRGRRGRPGLDPRVRRRRDRLARRVLPVDRGPGRRRPSDDR